MSDLSGTPVPAADIPKIKITGNTLSGTPVPSNLTGDIQVSGPPSSPGGAPNSPTTSSPSDQPESLLTEAGHGAEDVGHGYLDMLKMEGQGLGKLAKFEGNEDARVGSRVAEGLWRSGTSALMQSNPAMQILPMQVDDAVSKLLNIPADELATLRKKYTTAPQTTAGNVAENIATLVAGAIVPMGDAAEAGAIGNLSEDAKLQSSMVQMGFKPIPKEAPVLTPKTRIAKSLQAVVNFKGKAVAAHNIKRAEELTRNEFGLPEDTPLTPDTWMNIRHEQGLISEEARRLNTFQPTQQMRDEAAKIGSELLDRIDENPHIYGTKTAAIRAEIESVRSSVNRPFYTGDGIVDAMRSQREQADVEFNKKGDVGHYQLADIHRWAADTFEEEIGRQSELPKQQSVTSPGLSERLKTARRAIAKTYDYEGAMRNGRLSPRTLARAWRRFHKPLSGNALLLARYADRMPQSFADTALSTGEDSHQVLRSLALYELLRYADPKLLMAYAGEKGLGKLAQSDMLQATPEEIEVAGRAKRSMTTQRAGNLGMQGMTGLAAEEGSQPQE